jgi:hypothetical protein
MTMRPSAALAMPDGLGRDDAAFEAPLIAAGFLCVARLPW